MACAGRRPLRAVGRGRIRARSRGAAFIGSKGANPVLVTVGFLRVSAPRARFCFSLCRRLRGGFPKGCPPGRRHSRAPAPTERRGLPRPSIVCAPGRRGATCLAAPIRRPFIRTGHHCDTTAAASQPVSWVAGRGAPAQQGGDSPLFCPVIAPRPLSATRPASVPGWQFPGAWGASLPTAPTVVRSGEQFPSHLLSCCCSVVGGIRWPKGHLDYAPAPHEKLTR